ncbi:flavin-containing monooxygenase [Saccharopolyspora spinosa]|uniref:flavin-containing monooxygenase n=1 Tax=Saccharopolyspora spinosa TaxID=60894 RepID=UPI0016597E8C|nr:NAD(P)/FAD-dependent oxidoreductase [Saccharopolyspora spinosa]
MIGAGLAGVAAAKVMKEDGFDVTVFDKYDQVGGIWSPQGFYDGLRNQSPDRLYEFSDLPNPRYMPRAAGVQEYLQQYAKKFGVLEFIHPDTEVVSVRPVATDGMPGSNGWDVHVRSAATGPAGRTETFDYVVVASGAHHVPYLPDIPGRERFTGEVTHCKDLRDEQITGQRVTVVGGGKSALEVATRAASNGSTVTLVQRHANWMFPERLLFGTVRSKWLLFSRLSEALLPTYHDPAYVRRIDRIPASIKKTAWRLIMRDTLATSGLSKLALHQPTTPLPHGLVRFGSIPRGYVRHVRQGNIRVLIDAVDSYTKHGLRLTSGAEAPADIIVFATGQQRKFPFLEPAIRVNDQTGHLRLYKGIVPPETKRLGLIGFRHLFQFPLGMELCSHWLSSYFLQTLRHAPKHEEMVKEVENRLVWQDRVFPGSGGYEFGPYTLHSADELLDDMGLPTRRASNFLADLLLPVNAEHYAGLAAERRGRVHASSKSS